MNEELLTHFFSPQLIHSFLRLYRLQRPFNANLTIDQLESQESALARSVGATLRPGECLTDRANDFGQIFYYIFFLCVRFYCAMPRVEKKILWIQSMEIWNRLNFDVL